MLTARVAGGVDVRDREHHLRDNPSTLPQQTQAAARASPIVGNVDLPVMPPIRPMLAKTTTLEKVIAMLPYVQIEPKWDGFRCLFFKDGDVVELASRNTKPLTRYFPEVVAACRAQLPERIVLDG